MQSYSYDPPKLLARSELLNYLDTGAPKPEEVPCSGTSALPCRSNLNLQRYVDEYCWRANGPKEDGFDMLLSAQAIAGPLTYRTLVAKDL